MTNAARSRRVWLAAYRTPTICGSLARMRYRDQLPHLVSDRPFVADGGLETTLIFHRGIELPCFAAFDLLKDDATGARRCALLRAVRRDRARARASASCSTPPTWRANPDWGARARLLARAARGGSTAAPSRCARSSATRGATPRADRDQRRASARAATATTPTDLMTRRRRPSATTPHQIADVRRRPAADMVTAITMTYADEAIGIVRAAGDARHAGRRSRSRSRPTGGCPSGQPLARGRRGGRRADRRGRRVLHGQLRAPDALRRRARGRRRLARPDPRPAGERVDARATPSSTRPRSSTRAIRPSSARELPRRCASACPRSASLGGCCGTDHRHVAAVVRRLV